MKNKIISRLIVLTLLLAMLCGISVFAEDTLTESPDSEQVIAVMELIDKIGDVTVHSGNKIKEARTAYDALDDSQKEIVENIGVLTDAESQIETVYSDVANTDYTAVYEATKQYMEGLGTPGVGSVGGEWMVICLTRSGSVCPEGYYENVVTYINENINDKQQLHRAKSTENSRVILALTSAGYDVTDVDGHNLLSGLSDMNYLKKQGVNGPVWALIAFDSYAYEIPQNENEETQATREGIISYILEKQLADGGWSIYGRVADPDMTGMAIQALAPYYNTNPEVAEAVEKALDCLSAMQNENGCFSSVDGVCCESCAQVVVALTSLGIDPEADERFIKNGISVVDALCLFAVDGGGFEHIPYIGLNGMATEQGQYALVAYSRFLEGKTFLFDMTDMADNTEDSENADDYVDDEYYEDEEYYDDEEYYEDEEFYEEDIDDSEIEEDSLAAESEEQEEQGTEPAEDEPESTEKLTFSDDTFEDVQKSEWYYESVKYVYENNLMQGAGKEFEPESKMTRAMLVTVLYRMENTEVTENTHGFADVPTGEWYYDAVAWAASNEIVSGVSETEFAPDEEITREQLALIIYRYAKIKGVDVTSDSNLEKYADANKVSDWALDALEWANSVKLINGTNETELSPTDTATRAQVAAILMRFRETVAGIGVKKLEAI